MNNHQIKLATAETCTGCTACYSICPHSAIDMRANTAGFRYPIINSTKCVGCGLCSYVCPSFIDVADFVKKGKLFLSIEEAKKKAQKGGK